MAIAGRLLTYEEYLCGPEEMRRYDILDGEQIYMTNPTIRHQRIQGNLFTELRVWCRKRSAGICVMSPIDVLIRRYPLRTRQPDVLFISQERLGDRSLEDPAPLEPAPELVAEILSPSDRPSVLSAKLADYAIVGVLECWILQPRDGTIEVLAQSGGEWRSMGVYGAGQKAQSTLYSDLQVAVDLVLKG